MNDSRDVCMILRYINFLYLSIYLLTGTTQTDSVSHTGSALNLSVTGEHCCVALHWFATALHCDPLTSLRCVAVRCRPTQVRWQLMVASCHRRSGNYPQALETYKSIHRKFPDNVEC